MTTLLLALTAVLVLPSSTASADPLPATYSASAGGDVTNLDVSLLAISLADVGLATSSATVDSTTSPRSTATASNLAAAVVGLPITPLSNSQTAPPDNAAPTVGPLPGLNAPAIGLNLGLLESSTHARWAGDTACVSSDSVLAETTVSTTGVTLAPLGLTEILELGVASTTGTTRLAPTGQPGDNRAVTAESTGALSGLSLINNAIGITIADEPVVTASATGVAGGATTDYVAPEVTVTLAGTDYPLVPGGSVELNIPLVASVTVSMPEPTTSTTPDGRDATIDLTFLQVEVELLGLVPGLPVATATIDLLPLHAEAHAPNGGVSCPLAAPTITAPTPAQVTGANPTIAGTGTPGATVTVILDGTTAGTATVSGGGTWLLPVGPLASGAHDVFATQQAGESISGPSNTVGFTVDTTAPAAPVILTPADGSITTDTTPTVSGTAEPGSTVAVSIDGTLIGTTVANPDGTWTLDTTDPLGTGPHTVTATATDPAGNVSPPGSSTFAIGTVPSAPIDVSAVGGDANARVKWHAPLDDGGAPLLTYEVETTPGGAVTTVPASELAVVVTSLLNDTDYTFRVRVNNQLGWSPWSEASNVARPRGGCTGSPFVDVGPDHAFCPEIKWMGEKGVSRGWADNTYRPTEPISRQAMAAFTYRLKNPGGTLPACTTQPFVDVGIDDAFCSEITWMRDTNITTGYGDNTFRPNEPVARHAMAAFLYRLDGSPRGGDPQCTVNEFTDVSPDHIFCGEIRWLVSTGVTEGYPDGSFGAAASISREAMAAFVFRYNIYAGLIA